MLVDVVMPKMGESITEGTILEWRKGVGDTIAADEILLEIGTDKVDSEIPSPNAGVIAEILAEPNDVVEVGKVIVRIETDGDVAAAPVPEPEKEPESKPKPEPEPVQATEQPAPVTTPEPPPDKSTPQTGEKKYYTPLVKSIARKEGISQDELAAIQGTGKNGRVTKKDLLAYIETRTAVPTAPPVPAVVSQLTDERVEMDKIRKSIAEHMRMSLDTSAHFHLMNEVDMTHIVQYVDANGAGFKSREGFSLTYTPF
ncbi:MAG: biotin/lipoyl-containing protein, partial [Candidatus Marinimicrobia bacterium]|nr:biotin/lipoyl-containing protein [Candidatus Neomarinimicrobiota bacterium]